MGAMAESDVQPDFFEARTPTPGKVCRGGGSAAVIRKDGCAWGPTAAATNVR